MPLFTELGLWGNAWSKFDKVQQLSVGQRTEDCMDSRKAKAAMKGEKESLSNASGHGNTCVHRDSLRSCVSGKISWRILPQDTALHIPKLFSQSRIKVCSSHLHSSSQYIDGMGWSETAWFRMLNTDFSRCVAPDGQIIPSSKRCHVNLLLSLIVQ